jgi:glycosyltransferase involved in cell wall biosynthesis
MTFARLLDLTRSLRRAGRMATGVDRVEHAYLTHFLADGAPVFGFFRTAFGYVLLDRTGMRAFADRIEGNTPWGDADLMSRLPRGRTTFQKKAESDVRRLAIARVRRAKLPNLLAGNLPAEYIYYNVGHSNLTDRVLSTVHKTGGRIAAMVHDVIPLEHPEFQRERSVAPFRDKMRRVSSHADWAIYNSHDTQLRTEKYMKAWGRCPEPIVAHLGIMMPPVDGAKLPEGLPMDRPYFVTVGTIEPRKNHTLLLDIWAQLGPEAPPLFICGGRGWNNDAVFARLDRLTAADRVFEMSGLDDAAIGALVKNAAGSLFPSFAEGYGFPPLEALALGSRVLCNDLEVLREVIGKKAVYAPVTDRNLWITTVNNWEKNPPEVRKTGHFVGPSWSDHFKTVLRLR